MLWSDEQTPYGKGPFYVAP